MCHVVIKKGQIVKSNAIQLPDDKVIKSLEERESYNSFGVLEANEVMANEIKIRWRKSTTEDWEKCKKQS